MGGHVSRLIQQFNALAELTAPTAPTKEKIAKDKAAARPDSVSKNHITPLNQEIAVGAPLKEHTAQRIFSLKLQPADIDAGKVFEDVKKNHLSSSKEVKQPTLRRSLLDTQRHIRDAAITLFTKKNLPENIPIKLLNVITKFTENTKTITKIVSKFLDLKQNLSKIITQPKWKGAVSNLSKSEKTHPSISEDEINQGRDLIKKYPIFDTLDTDAVKFLKNPKAILPNNKKFTKELQNLLNLLNEKELKRKNEKLGESEQTVEIQKKLEINREIASIDLVNINLQGKSHQHIALPEIRKTPEGIQIVNEFSNQNVSDLLKTGNLSPAEKLNSAVQVAAGLFQLHKANIVHSDFDSSSILVKKTDGENEFAIGNWGHARLAGTIWGKDEIGGAIQSASPELLVGEALTTASDVWSFGIFLLELLEPEGNINNILSHEEYYFGVTGDESYIKNQLENYKNIHQVTLDPYLEKLILSTFSPPEKRPEIKDIYYYLQYIKHENFKFIETSNTEGV